VVVPFDEFNKLPLSRARVRSVLRDWVIGIILELGVDIEKANLLADGLRDAQHTTTMLSW